MIRPRRHQQRVEELCQEIIRGRKVSEILVQVTTGGGKSALPVIIANRLIPSRAKKLCWVVPRRTLKRQAEQVFSDGWLREWLGSARTIRADQNDIDPSRNLHGYVTTYQAIDDNPELHRREFERFPYILVLDEFHHFEEGSRSHEHLRPLVDRCALLVLMTGTLDRGDRKAVAFMRYKRKNGTLEPDLANTSERAIITYSRSEAIEDKAILLIEFTHGDGATEFVNRTGESKSAASFSEFEGEDVRDAICAALKSDYAKQLLGTAARDWIAYRKSHPTSQFLVVANRVERARVYKEFLSLEYGIHSEIAVHEDGKEADAAIRLFRERKVPCLVTVGMAYEGMDAPGITHIACLTAIRSRPWIEQMLGRGVRVDREAGEWHKQSVFAYVPDDELMNATIEAIREEQTLSLREIGEERDGQAGASEFRDVVVVKGDLTSVRYSELDGEEMSQEESLRVSTILAQEGLAGIVAPVKFLRAFRAFEIANNIESPEICSATPSERESALLAQIEEAARAIDYALGRSFGDTNTEIVRRFGKRRPDMTEDELARVWSWIVANYAAYIPGRLR